MTIDLQPFCADSSDPRDHLRRPAVLDGHTVATNGHILIRVPGEASEAGALPDCAGDLIVIAATETPRPICWWCNRPIHFADIDHHLWCRGVWW